MTNHTIFTTKSQVGLPPSDFEAPCAICHEVTLVRNMTAGPHNAQDALTLICNSHMSNSHQLINLVADYITGQRFRLGTNGGRGNAWFL